MLVEDGLFARQRRFDFRRALIQPLRRLIGEGKLSPPWDDGAPIRAELFSVERLEEHARSLAAAQGVALGERRGASLAKRLTHNETVLVAAYHDIAEAIDARATITPAAEWLIDNFHVVEKQIRAIRVDLPSGYYRQLPKLASGPFAKYPRVFGVAWAFVAHTDSLFDPEVLRRFLRAYQEVQPLTIGELWAVPITLRIVLVENLRRIASESSTVGQVVAPQTRSQTVCWVLEAMSSNRPMWCCRSMQARCSQTVFSWNSSIGSMIRIQVLRQRRRGSTNSWQCRGRLPTLSSVTSTKGRLPEASPCEIS